jgi:hypothetical protein
MPFIIEARTAEYQLRERDRAGLCHRNDEQRQWLRQRI